MATPQQTQGIIEDVDNNPFIAAPNPDLWDTDDVANARAHTFVRRKLERIRYLIDNPPDGVWNQVQWDNLHRDLDRWILILNKAHYN